MLLFIGGYAGGSLKTSEILSNGTFSPGPALPMAVEQHCMIRLNETHSMLTGGFDSVSDKACIP